MTEQTIPVQKLIETAFAARKQAYAPYSRYQVGAALLCRDGQIYTGCNVENAAYGACNCAERTAVFKAVSEGQRDFAAIAVVGGPAGVADGFEQFAWPCGTCRQVLAEFCVPETFMVIVAKSLTEYRFVKLAELLPESFGPKQVNGQSIR